VALSTPRRNEQLSDLASVMRVFMVQSVLFQDAVGRWAGLNSIDVQCAGLLMLDGPITPTELARRTGLTAGGAITAVIDRLEAAGLARRVRDNADRRRVLVYPDTDAFHARIAPAYAQASARWQAYLATLTDGQVQTIAAALSVAVDIDREEIDALRRLRSLPSAKGR
jgi:DNA-binding MarR family transcriptional regulator